MHKMRTHRPARHGGRIGSAELERRVHREYHNKPVSSYRGKARMIARTQGKEAAEGYIAGAVAGKIARQQQAARKARRGF